MTTTACTESDGLFASGEREDRTGNCNILGEELHDTGVPRDGIPALSDPELVSAGDGRAEYLLGHHRVIGIEVGGEYIAIPHNILWWHEIVNLNSLVTPLAVTYCPLTGSSMVFDRTSVRGVEFGVSGLLLNNNLVMYDRSPGGGDVSFWPQMIGRARCGPQDGKTLERYPATEMRWDAWRTIHPQTRVVSGETGYSRDYRRYPYGGYEALDNTETLYPQGDPDRRRQPKERVLGIPGENGGGIAFPFLALDLAGPRRVVHEWADGKRIVVFWDRNAEAAVAYWALVDGEPFTFEVLDGLFVDVETGSEWSFEGIGISGAMKGEKLTPVSQAYVSFWFAWASFFPDALLWLP